MAFDWSGGYAAQWRVRRVDPNTWVGVDTLAGVDSVSIDRACDSTIESGRVTATIQNGASVEEGWYRIEMLAIKGSSNEHVSIATLLLSSTESVYERGAQTVTLVGRSVLAPAAQRIFTDGEYAPKGIDGAAFVSDLLGACTPAPVVVHGSFTLDDYVVFDLGSTYLAAAWEILNAADWCMQVRGDGTIDILPMPTEPALVLDNAGAGLLMPSISVSADATDVPNVIIVTNGIETVTAVNDNPASPTSTVARGRRVEQLIQNPVRVNGETLNAYANRMLEELSVVERSYSYRREWWPDVLPYSVVRGRLASSGLYGDLRIKSQSLSCGAGILVSETAVLRTD